MHAITLLHKLLSDDCRAIHKQRLTALMSGVEGLLNGHRLSIAGLGRSLRSAARVKHNIKRMDRLAGNGHLHQELLSLYQALSQRILGNQTRPVLLIDWSDARADRSLQLLRASAVYDGRSITVYEEIHPLSHFDNRDVRRRFLDRLRLCLPEGCCPIVITDAGFRVSWYQQIEALGWDWVSRVRGRSLVRLQGEACWQPIRTFYEKARLKPHALGIAELTQHQSHRCHLVLVRQRKRGRVDKTMYGTAAAGTRSLACARRQREPWLLATSLEHWSPKRLCALYRRRMQIEGTFRDMKNSQWGFQLRAHRSRCSKRLAVLVLIGTLATFVAWLIGLAAVKQNIHREYQAHVTTSCVVRRLLGPTDHPSPRSASDKRPCPRCVYYIKTRCSSGRDVVDSWGSISTCPQFVNACPRSAARAHQGLARFPRGKGACPKKRYLVPRNGTCPQFAKGAQL